MAKANDGPVSIFWFV